MSNKTPGVFVISLDFELFFGMKAVLTKEQYGNNIRDEHIIVPRLTELFERYNIHATWATVGLILCQNKAEMLEAMPKEKPNFLDPNLSSYYSFDDVGNNEHDDPYHFGGNLINLIRETPYQEIGTQTFSHFYCLEEGPTIKDFAYDLDAAIAIAEKKGLSIRSIAFPRNQYDRDYLQVCSEKGIKIYRGNETHWAYKPYNKYDNNTKKRNFRILDSFVNLSGHNTYSIPTFKKNNMLNIQASKFLRPYSPAFKLLEPLKLRRIYNSMKYAAKKGQVYHLWWHPHNFSPSIDKNFENLEKILQYYTKLNSQYGMLSRNMGEFADF